MNILTIAISLFVILFAITIHEAAHGWAANRLGDPTAQMLGRVTLNPIPHIDPIGTVLLPAMLVIMGAPPFGWAKPVPVNPLNLKNPKKDNLYISAAGPIANFAVAFLAIILVKNPNRCRPQRKRIPILVPFRRRDASSVSKPWIALISHFVLHCNIEHVSRRL